MVVEAEVEEVGALTMREDERRGEKALIDAKRHRAKTTMSAFMVWSRHTAKIRRIRL